MNLKSKVILPLVFLTVLGLAAIPRHARGSSCVNPQPISFPFALQAGPDGARIQANAIINGEVRSNGEVAGELFARVKGDVTASGVVTNLIVTGTVRSGALPADLPGLDIGEWKRAAELGGTVNGNLVFPVNSTGHTLGPKKINGDLVLEENVQVTIAGSIFVTGSIIVSSNARFELDIAFGSSGTVMLAQGPTRIAGNARVNGNAGGGFLLIASTADHGQEAIILGPNFTSGSTIFYARSGNLLVGENVRVIGAYGQRVIIGENTVVNFEPGLKFATFICPPPPSPTPPPPPEVRPSITASKNPNTQEVTPGGIYSYEIQVLNSGTATATAVTLRDTIDPHLIFLGSTPTTTPSTTLTFSLGDLSPQELVTIKFDVQVKITTPIGTSLVNSVKVRGGNFPEVNISSAPVLVVQAPGAGPGGGGGGGGSASPPSPALPAGGGGSGTSYEARLEFLAVPEKVVLLNAEEGIVIRNVGRATLDPGMLELTLPPELRLLSAWPPYRSITANTVAWDIPAILSGEIFNLTFILEPLRPGLNLLSTARYVIAERAVAYSTASENISGVAGALSRPPLEKVAAARLPRTGTSPLIIVFFLILPSLLFMINREVK